MRFCPVHHDARLVGPGAPVLLLPILLLSLLLAGCNPLLPTPEEPPDRFDFGPLPVADELRVLPAPTRLQALRAPSWLAGRGIPYRQLHRQPEAIRYYARHAWVAPPAELLQQRLESQLMIDRQDADSWMLDVELLSFEQVFVSEDDAYGVISMRATLRERRGEGRSLSRQFRLEEPIPANVRGAVSGLPKLADAALADLIDWIAATVAE